MLCWASQGARVVKNPPAYVGDIRDASLTPGSGRCPGERNGNPLQYSCLGNPMDRRAWQATGHRVTQSWTWLKRLSVDIVLVPAAWQGQSAVCGRMSPLLWISSPCGSPQSTEWGSLCYAVDSRLLSIWTERRSRQSILKEISIFLKEYQSWIFTGRTDAEAEAPYFGHLMEQIHWKRPWCWESLKAKGGGRGRGWDG